MTPENISLKQTILKVFSKPQLVSLATVTPDGKPWVRYVTLVPAKAFPLVFCTALNSRKIRDINNNPRVHLTCGNLQPPDDSVYLQIEGIASVSRDAGLKSRFWNPEWIRYFQGPEDPNYCIVLVDPCRIELHGPESFEPRIWEKND